jgi:hypothetical protein
VESGQLATNQHQPEKELRSSLSHLLNFIIQRPLFDTRIIETGMTNGEPWMSK